MYNNNHITQLLKPQQFRETISSRNSQYRNSQSYTPNKKAIRQIVQKSQNTYENPQNFKNKELLSVKNSNFQSSEPPRSLYQNNPSQNNKKRVILKDRHGNNLEQTSDDKTSLYKINNPYQSVYNSQFNDSQSQQRVTPIRNNGKSLANLLESSNQKSIGIIQRNFKSNQKQLNDDQLSNYHSYRRSYNSNYNPNDNEIDNNYENRILQYQQSKQESMSNRKFNSKSQHLTNKINQINSFNEGLQRRQSQDCISQISYKSQKSTKSFSQHGKLSQNSDKNSIYNREKQEQMYQQNQAIINNLFDDQNEEQKNFQKHFKKQKKQNNKSLQVDKSNNNQKQNQETDQELNQNQNYDQINEQENQQQGQPQCLNEYLNEIHQQQGLDEPMNQNNLEESISQYIQQNLGYFEHKSGLCLCSLCNCGFCKVNCLVHNQEQKHNNQGSKLWISNYAKEYRKKQQFNQEWNPKKAYDQYTSKLPGEFKSTKQEDYTQKEYQDRYKRKKHGKPQDNPFFSSTSYGSQFFDYNVNCYIPIKGSHQITVVPNTHLSGSSSYKKDFEKNKDYKSHKEKIIRPNPLKPFPNIDMFFSETTNKHDHDYKHSNQSQKIDAPKNSYVLGAPQFKGQFQTDYRKNFLQYQRECQARKIKNMFYQQQLEQEENQVQNQNQKTTSIKNQ